MKWVESDALRWLAGRVLIGCAVLDLVMLQVGLALFVLLGR